MDPLNLDRTEGSAAEVTRWRERLALWDLARGSALLDREAELLRLLRLATGGLLRRQIRNACHPAVRAAVVAALEER